MNENINKKCDKVVDNPEQ